jgi:UDP-glucuronate 4-epimerase
LAGTKFELYGNGTVERDFTYIDDCVNMITLLEAELRDRNEGFFDVVNIGGGHPTSMNSLISIAQNLLDLELNYEIGLPNEKDVYRTMADSKYLLSLVGDKPKTSLEAGIQKTIEWASELSSKEELISWVNSSI